MSPALLRLWCMFVLLLPAIQGTPPAARAGGSPTVFCGNRTVCVPTLGIAVTLPANWSTTLTSYGLELGPAPGKQAVAGTLLITLIGWASRCSDSQTMSRVAEYWIHHSGHRLHITDRPVAIAGAPALLILGLPGPGDSGVTLLLAHQGSLYGITTFNSPRTTLAAGERDALSHLQFIPRAGPFPPQPDGSVAKALRTCHDRG